MIELHRHLEGSVRIETLFELAREFRLPMISDRIEDWRRSYHMTPLDPVSYTNFFCKIGPIRRFFVRREIIERVAREAVEDARDEGVTRLELRFSPAFFCAAARLDPFEVTDWIARACRAPGIEVTFLATIGRSFPQAANRPTLEVALRSDVFCGLDLAGNELASDGAEYEDVFRRARERGMGVTIHAAEHPEAAANARRAVERLHATRVGHGVFTPLHELPWFIERGIVFEMCPTSNRWLGAWDPARPHPAAEFLRRGAKVTINTDDPRVFGARMSDEIEAAGLARERKKLDGIARGALFRTPVPSTRP